MPNTPELWRTDQLLNDVHQSSSDRDTDPSITQLTNGNIVVVWFTASYLTVQPEPALWRLYDPLGNALTPETQFGSGANDPVVTALPDGGFLIADKYEPLTASGDSLIEGWHFDADGNLVRQLSFESAWEPGSGRELATAANDVNSMTVYSAHNGGGYENLYFRTYAPSLGLLGPEVEIVDTSDAVNSAQVVFPDAKIDGADVTALTTGNFAVVYGLSLTSDWSDIRLKIYNSGGGFILERTLVDNGLANDEPSITPLAGGGMVVAWRVDGTGGVDSGVRLRVFDAIGLPVSDEITPAASVEGNQNEPVVAALAGGGFVVVWDDDFLGDVKGQRFDASGERVGEEFDVDVSGGQTAIDVVSLADGRFAVTWEEDENVRMEIHDVRDIVTSTDYDGVHWLIGTTGGDTLTDDVEENVVNGWDGNDTVVVTSQILVDSFDGGDGIDTIDWSESSESGATFRLFLGTATDAFGSVETMLNFENLTGTENADTVYGTSEANTLSGGDGTDTLIGANGDDTLHGDANDDTLIGDDGIDYLFGGTGADDMQGGLGGDTYFVDATGDAVSDTFDTGPGFDYVSSTITYTIGPYIERLGLDGDDDIDGTGNLLNNHLFGNSGANTLSGLFGVDTLYGFDGADRLHGGTHNDTLDGGEGEDSLYGEAGVDTLTGGSESDELDGGAGADVMTGGTGDDFYVVDNAGDTVFELANEGVADLVFSYITYTLAPGGNVEHLWLAGTAELDATGDDLDNVIVGNSGANTLSGLRGADTIYGFDGRDVVNGGNAGDTIDGGLDKDTLNGDEGGDTISGGEEGDTLRGGTGNDRMIGGVGNDVHQGGTESDTFVFTDDGEGNDRIDDWLAVDDQIEIDASTFGGGLAAGALAANRLVVGAAPTANQAFGQFLYSTANGQLSWDVDGTGAEGAVPITRLLNGGVAAGTLAVGDFDIVA